MRRVLAATARLGDMWQRVGPWGTTQLLFEEAMMLFQADGVRALRDWSFDRTHRVMTAGFKPLAELGLGDRATKSHNYRGTAVALFDAAMAELPIAPTRFEFIDYGSGMGRALLLAARYPFRRISGVEFSAELHEIATRNISGWRLPGQVCFDVRSILGDASVHPLPDGDCVLYFFNPFREDLLRSVIGHIIGQVREMADARRVIYVVYVHPSFRGVFDEFPELMTIARRGVLRRLYDIYEVEAARICAARGGGGNGEGGLELSSGPEIPAAAEEHRAGDPGVADRVGQHRVAEPARFRRRDGCR
jgi:SAM-dependent methyltransferase